MDNDIKDMITSFLAVLVALIITFGGRDRKSTRLNSSHRT